MKNIYHPSSDPILIYAPKMKPTVTVVMAPKYTNNIKNPTCLIQLGSIQHLQSQCDQPHYHDPIHDIYFL